MWARFLLSVHGLREMANGPCSFVRGKEMAKVLLTVHDKDVAKGSCSFVHGRKDGQLSLLSVHGEEMAKFQNYMFALLAGLFFLLYRLKGSVTCT